jgi:hypothetical protein
MSAVRRPQTAAKAEDVRSFVGRKWSLDLFDVDLKDYRNVEKQKE